MRVTCLCLFLVLGCAPSPPAKSPASFAEIEGKWRVISIEGGEEKEEGKETFEVKRDGEKWEAITTKDGKEFQVFLTLDTSVHPAILNLMKDNKIVGSFRVTLVPVAEGDDRMIWTAVDDSYKGVLERVR